LERDIDGGREVLKAKLPFVGSCQKELTEPRIPNMRGIMMARSKPLQVLPAAVNTAHTQVATYSAPAPKAGCKFLDPTQVEELVHLLHTEAKVI
jgi:electron transfer flavoprotein beta subunit